MGQIKNYANDSTISVNDKLLGTDFDDINKVKNYTFQSIISFLQEQGFVKTPQVCKVKKTTITGAQVSTLFTTPVTILDSSGTGNIKYPINVYIKRLPGTAYTLASNLANVVNDLSNSIENELRLDTVLTQTTTGMSVSPISAPQHIFYNDRNSFYKLKAAVGNPTGGTGGIEVYVTYIEITL